MGWISVDYRLPANTNQVGGHTVICFRPDAVFDTVKVLRFRRGEFTGVEVVTHWQPLPDPPA